MNSGSAISATEPLPAMRAGDRVLVAEDDPMFRKILQSWLQSWGHSVTVTEDGNQAWNVLQQEDAPDLLILDWVMPCVDGLELCRRIRAQQHGPYHYILIVTARDDRDSVIQGLEAGADDYLTKPFDKGELRARLNVGTRILRLQEDLLRAQDELRFQATHDGMTGVWNHSTILELLHREGERAARSLAPTGILMLDVDHFKKINDEHGHVAGDTVLKEVSHRIVQTVRSYDSVGRYGGEEFLVVLPECDQEHAQQSAERIRSAIARAPVIFGSSKIPVTVSIGATAAPGLGKDAIANADEALYRAKHAGRNRVSS